MQFLHHVHVPIIGAIENMSYFSPAGPAGEEHELFGRSGAGITAIRDMCGFERDSGRDGDDGHDDAEAEAAGFFRLPVNPLLADPTMSPVTTHATESDAALVFHRIARCVSDTQWVNVD